MSAKGLVLTTAIGLALLAASCTSGFLVTKDGKSYHFGSQSEAIQQMLCASGDLSRILAGAALPDGRKADLYRYNCTEPSRDKVKEVLAAMTREQRKELRLSFQKHGYDINMVHC